MIPAVLIYLLKANIALTLVFLAYRLGLRRLTFYTLNRVFLLMGIVVSSAFPLVNINPFVERHEEIGQVLTYVPDFSRLHHQEFNYWNILVYIFWTGVLVMLVRTLVQSFSMWRIHRSAISGDIDGTRVKLLCKEVSPFSFFRNIYINPTLHQPQELREILHHEQVHVRQWHSIDVVLGEINHIFHWFNPGAWLMKSAIRENLEFITDRYLIRQGVDKKNYQYNLLKISGVPYATAIANNFNFSHLKNRIMMMNKKKSSTFNMLRYIILGAMVGGIVLSLNYSKASAIIAPLHMLPVKDSAAPRKATVKPPVSEKTKAAKNTITTKEKSGIDYYRSAELLTEEAEVVIIQKNAMPKGSSYVIQLPENTGTTEERSLSVTTQPLNYQLKGNSILFTNNTYETHYKVDKEAEKFEDWSIPTPVDRIRTMGFASFDNPELSMEEARYSNGKKVFEKSLVLDNGQHPKITIRGSSSGISPLYVIDGVLMPAGGNDTVKDLDPASISKINVLKGKAATDLYGETGKNGVIQITTTAAHRRNMEN